MAKLRSTREIVVWAEVKDVLDKKIQHLLSTTLPGAADMRGIGFEQGRLAAYNEMLVLPRTMVAQDESDVADEKDRLAIRQSQSSQQWMHPDNRTGRS